MTVATASARRLRRAAGSVVEPLESRRLLAGDIGGLMGPLWYGPNGVEASGPTEQLVRAPRSAAAESTQPTVTGSRPANGATGVSRNIFVAADVDLPNVGEGIDPKTLSPTTVQLRRVSDNSLVSARLNTSGGGDSIVLTPLGLLAPLAEYKFIVTSGVQDTSGAALAPYESTFTTGTSSGSTLDPSVKFQKVDQPVADGFKYTGVTIGPDGKLYAGTLDGRIVRFDIGAEGNLSGRLVIDTVNSKNGGSATNRTRTITGIHFDPASTAADLTLWVSHGQFAEEDALNWTGKISRLTGPTLGLYADAVTGLPRSVRDHLTNQIDFGPDGALYVAQGSNTSTGAPDNAWGMRPESLLTGAVLRVDTTKIITPVNVKTQSGGTYDPFAPGAPVTLYATGVRNAYDLVWHTNGNLYAPANGGAAGGNAPGYTGAEPAPRRIDGTYDGTLVPALSNIAATQPDYLFNIKQGGYYGHPNETRGEYVLNGGNPTSGIDPNEVAAYPVGTLPDRNYRPPAHVFGKSFSPDGIIEYRGNAFGGLLQGRLMVTRYSGGDDIAVLEVRGDGSIAKADTGVDGLTAFHDPLDLIERNGDLYIVEHGGSKITLAKPVDGGGPGPETQPTILVHPEPQTVPEGMAATFAVEATGNGLQYQWRRNGVDIPGATGPSYTLDEAAPPDTGAQFQVVVSNSVGAVPSQPAMLTVLVNRAPVATITTPAEGQTYAAGDAFTFSGTGIDPEEGELNGAAFSWQVTFHRGAEEVQFVAPFSGDTGGAFVIPVDNSTAADVFYRIRLTVRDERGLVGEAVRDITPRKVDLTLASDLAGVPLMLDGAVVGPNLTFPSVVGIVRTLEAPATFTVANQAYNFIGWSDGATTNVRPVSTPNSAMTYTAMYVIDVTTPPPPPPPPPQTPDLAINAATVQRVGSGGRATVHIANRQSVPFNAPATLELFLSTDGTIDEEAVSVATVAKTLKLKSNATRPLKVKFLQPQVPADGNYFLVARVVDLDGASDVGASASTVPFQKPIIDFTGSMTSPTPTVVPRGGKVTTTVTVRNIGTVPASGQLAMAVFAVPQGASPTDPATPRSPLATLSSTVKVKAGGTKRLKLSFAIPVNLPPDTYTIAVELDAAGAFNEEIESNNIVVALSQLTVF